MYITTSVYTVCVIYCYTLLCKAMYIALCHFQFILYPKSSFFSIIALNVLNYYHVLWLLDVETQQKYTSNFFFLIYYSIIGYDLQ